MAKTRYGGRGHRRKAKSGNNASGVIEAETSSLLGPSRDSIGKAAFKDSSNNIEEEVKSTSRGLHQDSKPRADAPPSAASPELLPLHSMPISPSTSVTSDTSAKLDVVQAFVLHDNLNITFDPSEPAYTIKNAPMVYPSEATISEWRLKSLNRPRSSSKSEYPSIEMLSLPEQIIEEQSPQMWPDFTDGHLQITNPWRYADHDESPESIMMNHGDRVNHYPVTPYHTPIRSNASRRNMIPMDVPGLLMKTCSGSAIPTGQFDVRNNVWRIFAPEFSPGPDIRDIPEHPDHLEPAKLLEVQGLEMFGYDVHIAVRLVHTCHREDCTNQLRDDFPGIIVCQGCGPLSPIRYCSQRCQFDDLAHHWRDCGSPRYYPPASLYADPDISFPASFKKLCPMIRDISGFDSMSRHRIHLASNYFDGEYALFPQIDMQYMRIRTLPSNDEDLKRRIQRLINCALLDRRNKVLISYLYVLIRDALFKQTKPNHYEYLLDLRDQFSEEWDFNYDTPEDFELLHTMEPCECMWIGKANFSSCRDTCKARQFIDEKYRETGLKTFVDLLENKYWILRAWATRHKNVDDWRLRVFGKGFHGLKPKKFKALLPVLGVGFDGHISKDKVVGEWRPRLILEAMPPAVRMTNGELYQNPTSFIWEEPEA